MNGKRGRGSIIATKARAAGLSERDYLLATLRRHQTRGRAAKAIGMHASALASHCAKHNIVCQVQYTWYVDEEKAAVAI